MKFSIKQRMAFLSIWMPLMTWLSIFNGMEFQDYKWNWSENNAILAIQYLVNGFWGFTMVALPVLTFIVFMVTVTSILETLEKN